MRKTTCSMSVSFEPAGGMAASASARRDAVATAAPCARSWRRVSTSRRMVHDPAMDVTGKVVVITGGANGIGRALALRFAEEGAAGIVVADLDEARAQAVASEIGPGGAAMRCDVSSDAENAALIRFAEESFGPVDLFCANAGVGVGTD